MNAEIVSACDEVMTAAMNGAGQGIILVALVSLVLRLAARTNAATRHAVWLVTLLLLVGLIPLDYWRHHAAWNGSTRAEIDSRSGPVVDRERAARPALSGVPDESRATFFSPAADSRAGRSETVALPKTNFMERPWFHPDLLPVHEQGRAAHSMRAAFQSTIGAVGDRRPTDRFMGRPVAGEALDGRNPGAIAEVNGTGRDWTQKSASSTPLRERTTPFSGPAAWELAWLARVPRGASVVVLVLWAIVGFIRVTILVWRLRQLRMLKRTAVSAGAGVEALFLRLRAGLSGRRNVALRISSQHPSPVTLGYMHPMILLPAEQIQESRLNEVEPILRHELAHVCRGDDWVNLVQHVVRAGLFFHPAVWWVSQRISLEREIACDDCVLQQGGGPRRYALLLADLAGRMNGRRPTFAPGATSNQSQLQRRITMILNTHRNISPRLVKTRLGTITSAALLGAVITTYCAPRVLLAQARSAPPVAAAAKASPVANASADFSGADAPQSVRVAIGAPPAPAPADVDSGPKFKSRPDDESPAPRAVPAPPAPAVAPVDPAPPQPLAEPRPEPESNRLKLKGPRKLAKLPDNASIEERLERVEKMVEALLAQQGVQKVRPLGPPGPMAMMPLNVDRMKERIAREAARAADQSARAAKQAAEAEMRVQRGEQERWARLAEQDAKRAGAEAGRRGEGMRREVLQKSIEALRRERDALGREMERLGRELDRLQQEQKKVDEQSEQRGDTGEKQPTDDAKR